MSPPDDRFSADLPHHFGPTTNAPVARARDVVVCTTEGGAGSVDEARAHPPIASPIARRHGLDDQPVELGRGVSIGRLSDADAELVMNACTPRGHHFAPIRQFGQRYSFIREVPDDEYHRDRLRWDPTDAVWDALTLSRLIRDNAYSTRYAARIVDYTDGHQMVVYATLDESRHVYRLGRERDWLDDTEGKELARLLAAYWKAKDDLGGRVARAIWRAEYATWQQWVDLMISTLVGGIEALLKTERHQATKQFVRRLPQLAAELDIPGVDRKRCDWLYDARSAWSHGAHLRLANPATGPGTADHGVRSPAEEAIEATRCLQLVLRTAVRRCIEDPSWQVLFADDEAIGKRWPV